MSVYTKNVQMISGIFQGIPQESAMGITKLYHAIENTVANSINTTYVQCMMRKSGLIHLNTQWLSWNFSFLYSNWLYFLCNFYGMIGGGALASWLVRSSLERVVWVRALARDIVLCSWASHLTLTVPLSTQVYK